MVGKSNTILTNNKGIVVLKYQYYHLVNTYNAYVSDLVCVQTSCPLYIDITIHSSQKPFII